MVAGLEVTGKLFAAVAAFFVLILMPNDFSPKPDIDHLTELVIKDIEKGIEESDLSDLIEPDGEIHLNAPEIFDFNLNIVLENNEIEYSDELAEQIWERVEADGVFERMQADVEERLNEQRMYLRDPWNGYKQSDFVE